MRGGVTVVGIAVGERRHRATARRRLGRGGTTVRRRLGRRCATARRRRLGRGEASVRRRLSRRRTTAARRRLGRLGRRCASFRRNLSCGDASCRRHLGRGDASFRRGLGCGDATAYHLLDRRRASFCCCQHAPQRNDLGFRRDRASAARRRRRVGHPFRDRPLLTTLPLSTTLALSTTLTLSATLATDAARRVVGCSRSCCCEQPIRALARRTPTQG